MTWIAVAIVSAFGIGCWLGVRVGQNLLLNSVFAAIHAMWPNDALSRANFTQKIWNHRKGIQP